MFNAQNAEMSYPSWWLSCIDKQTQIQISKDLRIPTHQNSTFRKFCWALPPLLKALENLKSTYSSSSILRDKYQHRLTPPPRP